MPRKPAKELNPAPVDGGKQGSEYVPAPQRVERALHLLMPVEAHVRREADGCEMEVPFRPGCSYSYTRDALMREFGVGETTAERDLANAYAIIRDRVSRTDWATMARVELASLAQRATVRGDVGDWSVAKGAWERLGKWAGLEDKADEISLAAKLTDAALDIAIKQAVTERIEAMPVEELEALVKRRRDAE